MDTKLPLFPNFTRLRPHHQAELEQLVRDNHIYSDYNFVSLWSWDYQQQLKISTLNGNLVIRFQEYLNPADYFYSFIGTQNIDHTAKVLLGYSINDSRAHLKLIPGFVIDNLERPEDYDITEDRDNFDYVIAVGDATELKGHSESKKRSLQKLMSKHGHRLTARELDIRHDSTAAQIIKVFDEWVKQSKTPDEYKQNELRALKKLLDNRHDLNTGNLHVLGLFVDDKLNGFTINEILQSGFAMGHFKKSLRDLKGLSAALDNYTAKNLQTKGVSHINYMQDMGIEGLRQSKMGSNPVYFLKKYSLAFAAPLRPDRVNYQNQTHYQYSH
jgi:hypothetical protein